MSDLQIIDQAKSLIETTATDFNRLAKIHGAVTFEREASFAIGILKDNAYLASIAMGNQDALRRAVINVAAIGLTLNPVSKLAYLLPRDKKIILAVSYLGLLKLATDVGGILWAHADVVFKKDVFTLTGLGQKPVHSFDPFDENRGDIVGAYCTVKTPDGEFLTTHMNMFEIEATRDRSESWKAFKEKGKNTPWNSDRNEMIKKTVIRRAFKTWPKTDTRGRLEQAIEVSNEADPIDFSQPKIELQAGRAETLAIRQRALLDELGKNEDAYLVHCTRVCRREIKSLNEMTENEARASIDMLSKMLDTQNSQESKNEIA